MENILFILVSLQGERKDATKASKMGIIRCPVMQPLYELRHLYHTPVSIVNQRKGYTFIACVSTPRTKRHKNASIFVMAGCK